MSPHAEHRQARQLFQASWDHLSAHERDVIENVLARLAPVREANREFSSQRSLGDRAADRITAFGGSWTFILMFLALMAAWAFLNTEILGPRQDAFDPYPYVFLNLVLSMLAALQAPIIMMSQNRQGDRDRLDADIDHEVNVRAELAIRSLGDRLDRIESLLAAGPAGPEGGGRARS